VLHADAGSSAAAGIDWTSDRLFMAPIVTEFLLAPGNEGSKTALIVMRSFPRATRKTGFCGTSGTDLAR